MYYIDRYHKCHSLEQISADYSLWAKYRPVFVFVNKVLLQHTVMAICLCFVYCCFHAVTAALSSHNRDHVAHKA